MRPMHTGRLRELRVAAGLTQGTVAAECGVDQATVSRWENGSAAIPDERKSDLARLFGVSRARLMGWDTDEEEVAS